LEEDRNYFWFELDGEKKIFTENLSPGKQVYKEKLLNKNISIDLNDYDDHIKVIMIDSGIGFGIFAANIKDILNPYFTTKKNGRN